MTGNQLEDEVYRLVDVQKRLNAELSRTRRHCDIYQGRWAECQSQLGTSSVASGCVCIPLCGLFVSKFRSDSLGRLS